MIATRSWLSGIGIRVSNKNNNHPKQQSILGILAFETARTMSRLISLYKSLTDKELNKLHKEILRSEGVVYLNSKEEGFLLNVACAELIEDLDCCAISVARLGKKCSDPALYSFEQVYSDLKLGLIDISKLDFVSKEVDKNLAKMQKLISATSSLYSGLESLSELEASGRKLNQWRHKRDLLDNKLVTQKQLVGHYQEVSLWNRTFDETVCLLARTICIVYARICVVFGPYISVLPQISAGLGQVRFHSGPIQSRPRQNNPFPNKPCSKSGPVGKTSKQDLSRFWSRTINNVDSEFDFGVGVGFKENHSYNYLFGGDGKKNKLIQAAPPSTLGGSGLALRYANVIVQLESYLNSPCSVGDDEREELYRMLPTSLKMLVRSKLRKSWRKEEGEFGSWGDESMAEGWRDALKVILGWLSPMAHDTVRWESERNFEKQNVEPKPTVLLLQTLHFSDREKTEAAITEILVGVSCIFRFENRCFCSSSESEDEFR
ncbi:hypothetical protein NE237_021547 [Protea cynaroides]|uniref:Uncharacterized protein n=1 Tax=Protea cynaroides TaxID=273540 RepID=A0A9Q0K3M7_9MAGN|nr:hypothetical protein NE237_021547 [Protea cynaroides]